MEIIWWDLWIICKQGCTYVGLIYGRNSHSCYYKSAIFTCRTLILQFFHMEPFSGQNHHLEDLGEDPKCSICGNSNLIILLNVQMWHLYPTREAKPGCVCVAGPQRCLQLTWSLCLRGLVLQLLHPLLPPAGCLQGKDRHFSQRFSAIPCWNRKIWLWRKKAWWMMHFPGHSPCCRKHQWCNSLAD